MQTNHESASRAHSSHAPFDIVVLAASLGGLKAISHILAALPADFPAAVLVVQHLHPTSPSLLVDLLRRHTTLQVKWAEQGDHVQPGIVYVAPPNQHLLMMERGLLALSDSPRVQWVRPSADVLFESVASSYRERAIAVVLTGTGCDGATGVQAIKQMGGRVLVQDMITSRAFGMPSAAIKTQSIDFILPLHAIAHALVALVMVEGAATFFQVQRGPLSRLA